MLPRPSRIPHLAVIQNSFGPEHNVSEIRSVVGGAARDATDAIGAEAYATGDRVAFRDQPDLHTAAHEAAHVVQQRAGVQLYGGVGEVGDVYERHADAVADRVVAGESASGLLNVGALGNSTGNNVQFKKHYGHSAGSHHGHSHGGRTEKAKAQSLSEKVEQRTAAAKAAFEANDKNSVAAGILQRLYSEIRIDLANSAVIEDVELQQLGMALFRSQDLAASIQMNQEQRTADEEAEYPLEEPQAVINMDNARNDVNVALGEVMASRSLMY